ncbi:MAG: hypothetical protein ACODAQ_02390 [Phycisphaeraceae bacterium]
MSAPDASEQVIAAVELDTDAPIGTVLDRTEPDWTIEQRYLEGWFLGMTPPAWWGRNRQLVITDDELLEKRVLEHIKKDDDVLLTGSDHWRNYAVEASLRQLLATTNGNADDEHARLGRLGPVARQVALRRYYYFCIEGHDRFALYRRRDQDYLLLASFEQPIDPARYYRLRLHVQGSRLRGYVDGELVVDVHDHAYERGRAGVRFNTMGRIESIRVLMTPPQRAAAEASEAAHRAAEQQARRRTPQLDLCNRIDVPRERLAAVAFAQRYRYRVFDQPPRHEPVLLLLADADETPSSRKLSHGLQLRAMNLAGETRWRCEADDVLQRGAGQLTTGDFTGRGGVDVAAVTDRRLLVIDGQSGEIVRETALPAAGPYQEHRGGRTSVSKPHALRLDPEGPMSLLVREDTSAGGNSMWAYDHQLNLLWERHLPQPKFGHVPWFYDIDGDGCDEILLGYRLMDHDGRVLWTLERAEYAERLLGARHADNVFLGKLHGDESDRVTALFAGGSDGLFFADGHTGEIFAHHELGHVQHLEVGRYRPDLPGLQVCAANRWANFGITTFLDNEGAELFQFQPDHEGEQFVTVRWGADHDLIFMNRSEASKGLWDAFGRRVVELPENMPLGREAVGQTAVADLDGDGRDELLILMDGQLHVYRPAEPGERPASPSSGVATETALGSRTGADSGA